MRVVLCERAHTAPPSPVPRHPTPLLCCCALPLSIASLAFNHDGSLLAIASSYTFEEGEKDHPEDAIFIRRISDSEVKPKPRAK